MYLTIDELNANEGALYMESMNTSYIKCTGKSENTVTYWTKQELCLIVVLVLIANGLTLNSNVFVRSIGFYKLYFLRDLFRFKMADGKLNQACTGFQGNTFLEISSPSMTYLYFQFTVLSNGFIRDLYPELTVYLGYYRLLCRSESVCIDGWTDQDGERFTCVAWNMNLSDKYRDLK